MFYLHTYKNPKNFGIKIFGGPWNGNVGIFYARWEYFTAIWYYMANLWSFGTIFRVWYVVPRKIWQP
jgi:hypothetical protein